MQGQPITARYSQTTIEKPTGAKLTLLRREGFIGKTFSLDQAGLLKKDAAGQFTEFIGRTFDVGNAFLMRSLVDELTCDMALIFGIAPDLPVQFDLSSGGHQRNQQTFRLQPGPGWLLLDYDTDQMPAAVRQRIDDLGGPLSAMEKVWPELKNACRVFKPSSSSGVYRLIDAPPEKYDGFHLYVLVEDQRISPQILKVLEARAWAQGLGWIKVSQSGSLLVRSIFDTAVGAPERLVFAGPPELRQGVGRVQFPIQWQEGILPRLPQMPEACVWEPLITAAKEKIRPTARKRERDWTKDQVRRAVAAGTSVRSAFRSVKERQFGGILSDDTVLDLNDGSTIKVGDLLDQGSPVGGKLSLPSPLDGLVYGSGKATLLWGQDRFPIIIDHAHGLQRRFLFARFSGVQGDQLKRAKFFDVPALGVSARRDIAALLARADSSNARDRVVAASKQLFWSVPAQWGLMELIGWLKTRVNHCQLPSDFWVELEERLARWLQARRALAISTVNFRPCTSRRHNVRHISSLVESYCGMPTGVLLVQAPMGTGKTQHIGVPLVARAKEFGQLVTAICHRVTLTAELANRLGLANYQTSTREDVSRSGSLAVCLPSILRHDLWPVNEFPEVLFIDEIRQVIDFFADPDCFRSGDASAEVVLAHLVEMVRGAKTVIGADAHLNDRTIEFLERCRPGETFEILTMQPTARSGTIEFRYGIPNRVKACVFEAVISELLSGGKVWLACESRKLAEEFDAFLKKLGFQSIAITASNKIGKAQTAFLANADAESRNYDVVVSSPAISSGISIEHRDGTHFTLGVFVGGGYAILPTDAVQQIGRVRYLKRVLVGVMSNNRRVRVAADDLVLGREQALAFQDTPVRPNDYAHLAASIDAEAMNTKADFAATLYWLLENEGWQVQSSPASADQDLAKDAHDAALDAKIDLLNSTPVETLAIAMQSIDVARNQNRGANQRLDADVSTDLELRLEAARIRECLGVVEITHEDYALWDDGRLVSKINRFENFIRSDAPQLARRHIESFWLADLRLAGWKLYQELLEGFDIGAAGWLTPEAAETLIDRVLQRPALFAATGVVGPKFYSVTQDRPASRPKSAVKAIGEIFGRAGLALRGEQTRVSQMTPALVNNKRANCDKTRVRVYSTVGFVLMLDLLRIRNEQLSTGRRLGRGIPISLRQLRRSLRVISDMARATLERLQEIDDGHDETVW